MDKLTGKVAIVTGASAGIGHAIAKRLAQEGATVVVNYGKSADKAKAVVAEIEAKGGKALAMQADMSQVADARRLVRDTVQRFARLDILVNNAAISLNKALVETTEQEFDQIFALNTKGPYFAMQEAANISGISGDMREILTAMKQGNSRATLAFDMYVHRLQASIGAMVAVLGGLDALVFTAGVGENSAEVRAAACGKLGFLGLKLDDAANANGLTDADIAIRDSAVRVLIIRAQEDWTIATECW
ncbi:MAG: hypothetical protein DMG72_24835, partial [Acidobacteria bacterium]